MTGSSGKRFQVRAALPPLVGLTGRRNTAADEVNDLEPVTVVQSRCRPEISGNDVAIEFHRDTVCLHAKALDQGCKRKWSGGIGNVPVFSVDLQFHSGLRAIR